MDAKKMKAISDLDQSLQIMADRMPGYRGQLFKGYMENGFTRDEAFTLIVEELWAQSGGCSDEDDV